MKSINSGNSKHVLVCLYLNCNIPFRNCLLLILKKCKHLQLRYTQILIKFALSFISNCPA